MKQIALIVDLDGTLTDNTHRLHMFNSTVKDWKAINERSRYDLPNLWCQNLINLYSQAGYKIIFLTGRSEEFEDITREWLMRYVSPAVDYTLLMRGKLDTREDFEMKLDIYRSKIEPLYEVEFCIDDRTQVVNMWRALGLTCLQCKEDTY